MAVGEKSEFPTQPECHALLFTTSKDFSLYPLHIDLLGEQKVSPFKEVDEFVLTLVCKDGIQGSKRQ